MVGCEIEARKQSEAQCANREQPKLTHFEYLGLPRSSRRTQTHSSIATKPLERSNGWESGLQKSTSDSLMCVVWVWRSLCVMTITEQRFV
jgi:hypothetical protein